MSIFAKWFRRVVNIPRFGPIVLRDSTGSDPREDACFAEAVAVDPDTKALSLSNLGPQPFWEWDSVRAGWVYRNLRLVVVTAVAGSAAAGYAITARECDANGNQLSATNYAVVDAAGLFLGASGIIKPETGEVLPVFLTRDTQGTAQLAATIGRPAIPVKVTGTTASGPMNSAAFLANAETYTVRLTDSGGAATYGDDIPGCVWAYGRQEYYAARLYYKQKRNYVWGQNMQADPTGQASLWKDAVDWYSKTRAWMQGVNAFLNSLCTCISTSATWTLFQACMAGACESLPAVPFQNWDKSVTWDWYALNGTDRAWLTWTVDGTPLLGASKKYDSE